MSKKLYELSMTEEGKEQLKRDLKKNEMGLIFKYGGFIKVTAFIFSLFSMTVMFFMPFLVLFSIPSEISTRLAVSTIFLTLFILSFNITNGLEKNMREKIKDHIDY